ncbi:MAG: RNA polymerase sigma-54 factor [Crocinitomicaceae bacterium]|nr:RNA polymerase sigma-54 factor [Crocinitomicaceae bacterium]
MALKQFLSQKQDQRLSPQQIQLMKLLQVPTMELEQRIKQEIEENPALEEGKEQNEDEFENQQEDTDSESEQEDFDISDYLDDDHADYKTKAKNQSKDEDERAIPLSGEQTFRERLSKQLYMLSLSNLETVIAETIIGNLDESGYLSREIDAIVDDIVFSQGIEIEEGEVTNVLNKIQSLDPAGIGARDLKECLLLQINRNLKGNISRFTAKKILENHFEEFTKKHYQKIIKKLDISEEDLKDAINEILKLNPKPGGSSREAARNIQQIIPDFRIMEIDGKLELTLNGRNAPELKVSGDYKVMLKNYSDGAKTSKSDKDALVFVKKKLDSAKWFIDAIKQRQNTLLLTMNSIMEYQHSFFLSGDETQLKPMILKDIADIVKMDISTISRVANSKHVQTSFGVYSLKYFFSESLSTESGEEVSTREVKSILSDAVDSENKRKPLPDEKLMQLLRDKGYNIARRTVAKYREQLNIPVARLRKQL